jgi:hypothetical protein
MQLYDTSGELLGDQNFTTNASGHYQIRGIPNGAFHLVLGSSGPFVDDSQVYPGIPCPENCDPLLGQTVAIAASGEVGNINFSFHTDALVHGKITDATSGSGLDGVVVNGYFPVATPFGTSYALAWSTTSHGPDGAYELYLRGYAAGALYYIVAEPAAPYYGTAYPGVSCTFIESCMSNGVPLLVHPAAAFEGINMALPMGSAISGRVLDATSGAPLLAFVTAYDEAGNSIWSGLTDEDGYYSSKAFPEGTYSASASTSGWPFACAVYLDRPCPRSGAPVSSVNPTPLVLQVGEVRADTNFQIDTDTIFVGTFDP